MKRKYFNLLWQFGAKSLQGKSFSTKKKEYFVKTLVSSAVFGTIFTYSQKYCTVKLDEGVREVEAGLAADFEDGSMKEVQVGPQKEDVVLVCKVDGKFYACGSKCSHAGAPLVKGLLFDDKLYCPLHDAAFSVISGYPEQGPVFDGIPTYPIREEDGKLYVKVPKALKLKESMPMGKQTKTDHRKFVIIGFGPAALSAIETLRQSGFGGKLIVISKEENLPYDRTLLSKNIYKQTPESIQIRDKEFFEKHDVQLMMGTTVKYLNIDLGIIEIEGKDKIHYDKLLIATGARPKVPMISGTGLQNVMTLRKVEDMEAIKSLSKQSKNIVIVGGSYIGLETASAIKSELKGDVNITVVCRAGSPLERGFGSQVGKAVQKLFEENGINFVVNEAVKSIEGGGQAKEVVLSSGKKIPADMVLLGTGVQPNTELVSHCLRIASDGGIYTDPFMRTVNLDIFAAGDVASYPFWYTGERIRVEHYSAAIQQGSIAAFNMLGRNVPNDAIPFFWTRFFNKSLQHIGNIKDYDKTYVDGDLEKLEFIAYYIKGNQIVSAAAMNRNPMLMLINAAMELNVLPSASDLIEGKVTLDDVKKRVLEKRGKLKCKRDVCCKKNPLL